MPDPQEGMEPPDRRYQIYLKSPMGEEIVSYLIDNRNSMEEQPPIQYQPPSSPIPTSSGTAPDQKPVLTHQPFPQHPPPHGDESMHFDIVSDIPLSSHKVFDRDPAADKLEHAIKEANQSLHANSSTRASTPSTTPCVTPTAVRTAPMTLICSEVRQLPIQPLHYCSPSTANLVQGD